MIVNTYSVVSQAQYGAQSTGSVNAWAGEAEGVTLEDILACCQQILTALRGRAFRRERPSRQELWDKINQVMVESVDIRKELKRLRLMTGENNADK